MKLFSDKPRFTHVSLHEIHTGNAAPVAKQPYRYYQIKQNIIDYPINTMLDDDIIMTIDSPFA